MAHPFTESLESCRRRVRELKISNRLAPYRADEDRSPLSHNTHDIGPKRLDVYTIDPLVWPLQEEHLCPEHTTNPMVLDMSQLRVDVFGSPQFSPPIQPTSNSPIGDEDDHDTPTNARPSSPATFYPRPRRSTPSCPALTITTDTPSPTQSAPSPITPSTTPRANIGLGLLHIDDGMRLNNIGNQTSAWTAFEEDDENDDDGHGLWKRLWEQHAWYNSPELGQAKMVQIVGADEVKSIVVRVREPTGKKIVDCGLTIV